MSIQHTATHSSMHNVNDYTSYISRKGNLGRHFWVEDSEDLISYLIHAAEFESDVCQAEILTI